MPSSSRIALLADEDFWTAYLPLAAAFQNPSVSLKDQVRTEFNCLDRSLRSAIDRRWKRTAAYYEFNDDWNVCRHHSMGTYSDAMCCGDFLDIVEGALARANREWCFHVALECDQDFGWGLQHAGRGQIFFYRGHVYGNRDEKFDYKLFDRCK